MLIKTPSEIYKDNLLDAAQYTPAAFLQTAINSYPTTVFYIIINYLMLSQPLLTLSFWSIWSASTTHLAVYR